MFVKALCNRTVPAQSNTTSNDVRTSRETLPTLATVGWKFGLSMSKWIFTPLGLRLAGLILHDETSE